MIAEQHDDITYRVIGAAMRVHNALGPGLKESAYQKALSIAFEQDHLSFQTEHPVDVVLDGVSIGLLYLDHLVEEEVLVEEKAVSHPLTNDEVAQVITYLCASGNSVGLLLNFGRNRLEYKRIFPPQKTDLWRTRIHRYVWNPVGSTSVNSLPIR